MSLRDEDGMIFSLRELCIVRNKALQEWLDSVDAGSPDPELQNMWARLEGLTRDIYFRVLENKTKVNK